MNKEDDKIVFKREIVDRGIGLAIQLPKEIIEYLLLDKGTQMGIITENGKHGKYIAIYKLEE